MSGGDFKLGCNLLHIWGATSEKRAVGLAVLRFPVLALISTTDKVFFYASCIHKHAQGRLV